jgi:hypothetical protein
MPDEDALLRWETEGGASRRESPGLLGFSKEKKTAEEATSHADRAERLGPPPRQPRPAASGPAGRRG